MTISYTYDKTGRLETFNNGFRTTTYEYDLLDRVTRVVNRNGKATVYEYDAVSNRIEKVTTVKGELSEIQILMNRSKMTMITNLGIKHQEEENILNMRQSVQTKEGLVRKLLII